MNQHVEFNKTTERKSSQRKTSYFYEKRRLDINQNEHAVGCERIVVVDGEESYLSSSNVVSISSINSGKNDWSVPYSNCNIVELI